LENRLSTRGNGANYRGRKKKSKRGNQHKGEPAAHSGSRCNKKCEGKRRADGKQRTGGDETRACSKVSGDCGKGIGGRLQKQKNLATKLMKGLGSGEGREKKLEIAKENQSFLKKAGGKSMSLIEEEKKTNTGKENHQNLRSEEICQASGKAKRTGNGHLDGLANKTGTLGYGSLVGRQKN